MTSNSQEAYVGFSPDYVVPPGETLAELLEEHTLTQSNLAERLGVSPKHVNQVVKGAATISADLALGLEKVFRIPASFWVSREALYRAGLARSEERERFVAAYDWARRFPLADLRKLGFLPETRGRAETVSALLSFLGIAAPEMWRQPDVAFRKSLKYASDDFALAAWLRLGEIRASGVETAPYSEAGFLDALSRIRAITPRHPKDWQPRLEALCAESGVAVVIVDTFKGARANGATRWLSPSKALIQMSIRHKWEDIFWFSFFHEAGHVVRHQKKGVFVEAARLNTGRSEEWQRLEHEADAFASRLLIPPNVEPQLLNLSLKDIPGFAAELGIAPAIVVGRMHHLGVLPYTHGNHLRRRLVFTNP